RIPKYASTSRPANRARSRSSRAGRVALSASAQRAWASAVGGGAKSAGAASAIGLLPVLRDVLLVLRVGLREHRPARAVLLRQEVEEVVLGVWVQRRVDRGERRRGDRAGH